MGGRTETFGDVGSNELDGYERFVVDVAHDMEFQAMYSQGLDMPPDEVMGTRTAQENDGKYVSSGSKWKQGGKFVSG